MIRKIVHMNLSKNKLIGFRKSIWFKKMPLCYNCHGTGYIIYRGELTACFFCGGTGQTL